MMKKPTWDLLQGLLVALKAITGIVLLLLVGTLWMTYRLVTDRPEAANQPPTAATVSAAPTTREVPASVPSETDTADGKDIATGLLVGEGLTAVKANCLSCHSAQLVMQNRFTREGWHEKIVWMQETQGLWDLGENEPVILDYLAAHYAPERTSGIPLSGMPPSRRQPLTDIEWYELE